MKAAIIFLLLIPGVLAADCEPAFEGIEITKDTMLCNKAYDVPGGIRIATDNVVLDCNGAVIRGTGLADGQGVIIERTSGVTVKNCNIVNFDAAIYVKEASRNTIIDNTLLNNKVGIRLLQSYENRFENNADKSIIKPVSAIMSKFNSLSLSNKRLDKAFCETNLCNKEGAMNPCESNDFYCSPACNYENDNDCPEPVKAPAEEAVPEAEAPDEIPELAQAEAQKPAETAAKRLPAPARFWLTALLFIVAYLAGFIIFQRHHWRRRKR